MSLGMPMQPGASVSDAASRAKRSSWSPSVSAEAKENQAGVGILFVEEEDPSGFVRVTVKALIEGGSAEKTGMVKSGDMVVRVGNQDVIGKPLSILRTMIPGPIGSYCRLGFLRGGVALNSNAVQEKSTYYDVQLLRQPPKNDKRNLVTGREGSPENSTEGSSLYSSQNSMPKPNSLDPFSRYDPSASQQMNSSLRGRDLNNESINDKGAHSPQADRPLSSAASPGEQQGVIRSSSSPSTSTTTPVYSPSGKQASPESVTSSSGYRSIGSSSSSTWAPQSPANKSPAQQYPNSNSGSLVRQQSLPGLSQSYDQRSASYQLQQMQQPSAGTQQPLGAGADPAKRPDMISALPSNNLANSVDAAITNVDRALYEMQSREIERLKAKLEASERDKKQFEDDMSRAGKAPTPNSISQPMPSAAVGGDKRQIEMLQKQVADLKQEKQVQEMKRMEAESALKVMERRVSDLLQNQQNRPMMLSSARELELQEQLKVSEEKRREEEKKRAILEGKVRHLENQAKQNSPFRFQTMKTGKKGPPPHLPDISEGKEVTNMNANVIMGHSPQRSPTLGAIDGPVPEGVGIHPHGGLYGMQHMHGGMHPMHPNMQQNMQQSMQTNLYDSTQGVQNGLYNSLSTKPGQGQMPVQSGAGRMGMPQGGYPQAFPPGFQQQQPPQQQGMAPPQGQQAFGMQNQNKPPGLMPQYGQQGQQQGMKAPISPLNQQAGQQPSPMNMGNQQAGQQPMIPGGRQMAPQGQMQGQMPTGGQGLQGQQYQGGQQPNLYGSVQNNRGMSQQQPQQQGYPGGSGGYAPPPGSQQRQPAYPNR